MKRAVIYSRVSTDEQAEKGYSLDSQEKLCQSFAKNRGYEVVNVYRDEGKSGTSLKRPALQDLLNFCQTNHHINALIIQETDRLSRNTVNHLTIKAHLKEYGVEVISVNQPMLDDSPEGKMMDTVLAGVNQFYSDLNGRKATKGMQEKFDRGWFPGKAPLGYQNIMGSSLSPTQEKLLLSLTDKLLLFLDNDEAGIKATETIRERLINKAFIKIAKYPTGEKSQPEDFSKEELKAIL